MKRGSLAGFVAWPLGADPSLPLPAARATVAAWRCGTLRAFGLATARGPLAGLALLGLASLAMDVGIAALLADRLGAEHVLSARQALLALAALLAGRLLLHVPLNFLNALLLGRTLDLLRCPLSLPEVRRRRDDVRAALERDAVRVADALACYVSMAVSLAGLGACAAALVAAGGASGAAAAASAAPFLALSIGIGLRRARRNRAVYEATRARTDLMSRWCRHGAALLRWGRHEEVAGVLRQATREEIFQRNADARLRALDLYSMAFGKVLPTAVVLALGISGGGAEGALVLWIAMLAIANVMQLARLSAATAQGEEAFAHLRGLLQYTAVEESGARADATWELWQGSLQDNVLGSDAAGDLRTIGVLAELGIDAAAMAELVLEPGGANVSAGQRTRILLARALAAGRRTGARIELDLSLDSLDAGALDAVGSLLAAEERQGRVGLSPAMHASLERRSRDRMPAVAPRERVAAAPPPAPAEGEESVGEGLVPAFRRVASAWCALMIVPVVLLAATGSLAAGEDGAAVLPLVAVGVAGAVAAIATGMRIERRVRAWTLSRLELALRRSDLQGPDWLQLLTKDVSVCLESIAWYVHDIAWLVMLFASSAMACVVALGPRAGLLVGAVAAAYALLVAWASPIIGRTRRASAVALNRALGLWDGAVAAGSGSSLAPIREASDRFLRASLEQLFLSVLALRVRRSFVLSLAGALSGVLLLGSAILGGGEGDGALLAFLGTALVNLDMRASVLVAALTGFQAQRLSIRRLASEHPPGEDPLPVALPRVAGAVAIPAFRGAHRVDYRSLVLPTGSALSLQGPSGSGKSLYVSALADRYPAVFAVFGAETRDALTWRSEVCGEPPVDYASEMLRTVRGEWARGRTIVCLDEALASLPAESARALVERLGALAGPDRGLLVVDHRFALTATIDLRCVLGDVASDGPPLPGVEVGLVAGRPPRS